MKSTKLLITLCAMNTVYAVPLVELTGQIDSDGVAVADSLREFITFSVTGGVGPNPNNTNTTDGYWTSASTTAKNTSNTDISSSFTFTATGLAEGETIDLNDISFDYTRVSLNGSGPRLDIYVDTGNGYGDSVLTIDETPASSNETVSHALTHYHSLQNGESITFGFSYSDGHSLASRTHLIDNFVLNGTYDLDSENPGIDLNNNKVSDIWEYRYNAAALLANETVQNEDFDGDGVSNIQEGITGTDPRDPESFFLFKFGRPEAEEVVIESNSIPLVDYDFSSADNPFAPTTTSTYINASTMELGMPIRHVATVGDTTGVDAKGNAFATPNTSGSLGIAVDVANTNSFENAVSSNDYISFIVDPAGRNILHLDCLSFKVILRSSLSVNDFALADSNGNMIGDPIQITSVGALTGVYEGATIDLKGTSFERISAPTEFRIYAWGSNTTQTSATLSTMDKIRLDGSVSTLVDPEDNDLSLSFTSVPGKRYALLGSQDLDSWTEDVTFPGDGEEFSLLVEPVEGLDRYFYKLNVQDFDADNDGLTLLEEEFISGFSDNTVNSNGSQNDYERLKTILQSLNESTISVSTSGETTLYEDSGNRIAVTVSRSGTRGNEFLDLSYSQSVQIKDTTLVASNSASLNDYRLVDVNGNELVDGLVTIEPGELSDTVYVQAMSDNAIESDEQITFSIGDTANLNLWISDAEQIAEDDFIYISQAGHFLSQASMGGTPESISALANEIKAEGLIPACEAWIDNQMALPKESTVTQDCLDFQAHYLGADAIAPSINIQNFELVWWGKMVQTEEQFRHRMAFTLSQVFVTSSSHWANTERNNVWRSYTSYYDKLANSVSSTHRDLLQEISYDPFMGVYLSLAQNVKANPSLGTSPDENYAREVMQLFSCGVFTQNQNGVYQLDAQGNRLENYDNDDITEMAEVFTGLGLSDENGNLENFNNPDLDHGRQYFFPMQLVPVHHDESEKVLLNGAVIPSHADDPGRDGHDDISDALDVLAEHPSTAPHLSRLLIKRLTNSNPSNAYIGRVTEAWRGEGPYGTNQVGNFVSVFKAILLDPEARDAITFNTSGGVTSASPTLNQSNEIATNGRIKEPIIKWTQFYRFAQSLSFDEVGVPRWNALTKKASNDQTPNFGQIPMRAPSVFNYYDSEHSPATGSLALAEEEYGVDLTSPEAEILSPYVIRQFESFYNDVVKESPSSSFSYLGNGETFTTHYNYLSYLYAKNTSVSDFIDDINLWFCNGQLSADLRAELITIANETGGATQENFAAVLSIIFNSSDFSISF